MLHGMREALTNIELAVANVIVVRMTENDFANLRYTTLANNGSKLANVRSGKVSIVRIALQSRS